MSLLRRFAAVSTITVLGLAAACGGDDGPTAPSATPVIGVTTEAMSSSSVKISFTSHAGDNSYNIERAEGATGTFSQATSCARRRQRPAPVTYTDNSLKACHAVSLSRGHRARVVHRAVERVKRHDKGIRKREC
jgi:hypothetical protein